jgi:acyl-CoA synthetase (AMP-forming)/AMP-acid ligase II
VKSKILLALTFTALSAVLSAFLDALTVAAVVIAVATGLYTVYHRFISGRGFDDDHNHDDDGYVQPRHESDMEIFRSFLRSLMMHAMVGTALGGVATLVGEPQNLLIGETMGWDFLQFFLHVAPVSIPVFIAGLLMAELIDPDSGDLKLWQEGETGELVLTHLCKEAQPLVRFRTGDIITLTGTGKAGCGRTVPRFRVVGRSDDMVVVRGINVFPTQVAAVITPIAALSGEYCIVLNSKPPYDRLEIEVEQARKHTNPESLVAEIEAAIKTHIGVTAKIKLLDPETFPKTEGKTKRVRTYF